MSGIIQTFLPKCVTTRRLDLPDTTLEVVAEMIGGEWWWWQDGRSIRLAWIDVPEVGVLCYRIDVDGKSTSIYVKSGKTTTGAPTSWRAFYNAGNRTVITDCPVRTAAKLLTSILPAKL